MLKITDWGMKLSNVDPLICMKMFFFLELLGFLELPHVLLGMQ